MSPVYLLGIGMSAGAILFGEIAKTSKKEQRTAVFALYMSARQIGLVLGRLVDIEGWKTSGYLNVHLIYCSAEDFHLSKNDSCKI